MERDVRTGADAVAVAVRHEAAGGVNGSPGKEIADDGSVLGSSVRRS
jgi:hypothetical protein